MCFNMTSLGICFVDTSLAYAGCTKTKEALAEFYAALAEELIDNQHDRRGTRIRTSTSVDDAAQHSRRRLDSLSLVCMAPYTNQTTLCPPKKPKSASGEIVISF